MQQIDLDPFLPHEGSIGVRDSKYELLVHYLLYSYCRLIAFPGEAFDPLEGLTVRKLYDMLGNSVSRLHSNTRHYIEEDVIRDRRSGSGKAASALALVMGDVCWDAHVEQGGLSKASGLGNLVRASDWNASPPLLALDVSPPPLFTTHRQPAGEEEEEGGGAAAASSASAGRPAKDKSKKARVHPETGKVSHVQPRHHAPTQPGHDRLTLFLTTHATHSPGRTPSLSPTGTWSVRPRAASSTSLQTSTRAAGPRCCPCTFGFDLYHTCVHDRQTYL